MIVGKIKYPTMIPQKLRCPLKRDYFSTEYSTSSNHRFSGDTVCYFSGQELFKGRLPSLAVVQVDRITRRTPSPIPSCHRCNPGSVMEIN